MSSTCNSESCWELGKVKGAQSCPTLLGPLFTRLLCPWDSPGENPGVGCCGILQGIFPTQQLTQEHNRSAQCCQGVLTRPSSSRRTCSSHVKFPQHVVLYFGIRSVQRQRFKCQVRLVCYTGLCSLTSNRCKKAVR